MNKWETPFSIPTRRELWYCRLRPPNMLWLSSCWEVLISNRQLWKLRAVIILIEVSFYNYNSIFINNLIKYELSKQFIHVRAFTLVFTFFYRFILWIFWLKKSFYLFFNSSHSCLSINYYLFCDVNIFFFFIRFIENINLLLLFLSLIKLMPVKVSQTDFNERIFKRNTKCDVYIKNFTESVVVLLFGWEEG